MAVLTAPQSTAGSTTKNEHHRGIKNQLCSWGGQVMFRTMTIGCHASFWSEFKVFQPSFLIINFPMYSLVPLPCSIDPRKSMHF